MKKLLKNLIPLESEEITNEEVKSLVNDNDKLSARTQNCIIRNNLTNQKIENATISELLNCYGLGSKTINELLQLNIYSVKSNEKLIQLLKVREIRED